MADTRPARGYRMKAKNPDMSWPDIAKALGYPAGRNAYDSILNYANRRCAPWPPRLRPADDHIPDVVWVHSWDIAGLREGLANRIEVFGVEMEGRMALVPKDRADALAASLRELLSDPELPPCPRASGKECHTLRCLRDGGYTGKGGFDPDIATCDVLRARRALEAYEGDRDHDR